MEIQWAWYGRRPRDEEKQGPETFELEVWSGCEGTLREKWQLNKPPDRDGESEKTKALSHCNSIPL